MQKNLKIFIGPYEVAGYYQNLKHGFDELGADCDLIFFTPHPFGYDRGIKYPLLITLARELHTQANERKFTLSRYLLKSLRHFVTSIWGLYALFYYDAFIFGFGRTLLPGNVDLIILRLLKKRVIVNIAHGSDARPPYINGYLNLKDDDVKEINRHTIRVKRKVARVERYSSLVIGSPCSSSQFLKKPFINTFCVGAPFHENSFPQKEIKKNSSKVRILHAPSNSEAKGSDLIVASIDNLIEEGLPIEFIKIENMLHAQVLKEIIQADFIVDQLYSDTPMAGFPSEAAWYGKPAVVGGYAFDFLKKFVPDEKWPPSKICHPEEIEDAIRDLVVDKEQRRQIGAAAHDFIREVRSAKNVAANYLRLITDQHDPNWLVNPLNMQYVSGGGQSMIKTQKILKALISRYGISALKLTHNKKLEKQFLDLANLS